MVVTEDAKGIGIIVSDLWLEQTLKRISEP